VGILKDLYKEDYKYWTERKIKASSDDKSSSSPGDQTPRSAQFEQDFLAEMRLKLIRHETNIWACIFRIAKSDKQI